MTPLLWTLVAIQVAMGAFDTVYHHELTERLAWRPSQRSAWDSGWRRSTCGTGT